MIPVLLDLVSCEALRGQFPRGVPRRACLRRQLERKRDGKDWAPAYPSCAACELGRQVRAEVEAAGVGLGTCARHGAALVGEDVCERCTEEAPSRRERPPCRECGSTSKHAARCTRPGREPQTRAGVARESRPVVTLRGAPVSTVIWDPGFREPPIAAPSRHGAGLTPEQMEAAAERVREAMKRPTVVAAPPAASEPARKLEAPAPRTDLEKRAGPPTEGAPGPRIIPGIIPAPRAPVHAAPPPALPAEEDDMRKRKPMECCGSLGGAHKATCPAKTGKPGTVAKAPAAPAAGGGRPRRRPRQEEGGPGGARGRRRAA